MVFLCFPCPGMGREGRTERPLIDLQVENRRSDCLFPLNSREEVSVSQGRGLEREGRTMDRTAQHSIGRGC